MLTKLSYYRKNARLSQDKIAQLLGISVWNYQQIEKGKKRLSLEQAEILAQLYKIEQYDLKDKIDSMESKETITNKYRDKILQKIRNAPTDWLSEIDSFINYLEIKYKN